MSFPSNSLRSPRCPKTRQIILRSCGIVSLIRSSPPVTPASAMKLPISMWSGAIVVARSAEPGLRRGPSACSSRSPRSARPSCTSSRARSCTWGSQAALWMIVTPGVSAAAISTFSVAITDGSSMNTSPARRPCGARAGSRRRRRRSRPERLERVDMRIQPPAADEVAAGRRHLGAPEAREQRPGEQERRADPLAQRRRPRRCFDVGAAQRELVLAVPRRRGHRAPRGSRASTRRRGFAARWRAPARRRSAPTRRGSPAPVLVARRDDRAAQRRAAGDDEALHGLDDRTAASAAQA